MDWLAGNMWTIWIVAVVALAIAELASMDLLLAMLSASAFGALIASLASDSELVQFGVFAGLAVVLIGVARPILQKQLYGHVGGHGGVDRLIGMRTVSLGTISAESEARITLSGIEWKAKPYDPDEVIPANTGVVVLEIRRSTAYVMPLPPELQGDVPQAFR